MNAVGCYGGALRGLYAVHGAERSEAERQRLVLLISRPHLVVDSDQGAAYVR